MQKTASREMLLAASRRHTLYGRTAAFSRLMKIVPLENGIRAVDTTFDHKLGRGFGVCDRRITGRSIVSDRRRVVKKDANNDGGSNVSESDKELPLKEKFKVVWKR